MPDENRESNIMTIIYNKINDMIGAGNQLFSMQFPAQPLNPNLYRYDTQDRNSVLTKPFTVTEAEFRLADQLFDISPITAGSNGEKLSVVYNTAINNYIPKLDYLAPFIRDRAGLSHWLLESTDEKDEKGNILTRIELCKKLYQEYLIAKNAWNDEKNKKFEELRNKEGGMDEYANWLSSDAMVKTEELNNLYNDVVISGHLHEVLTILGYLNASSIAEELELGKQKMRNSARLSLDESLTVYPVQLSPNDWFKALSPNLNPIDLTMAKDSIRDIYLDKQKELVRARGDMQKIELLSTSPDDVKNAQIAVDSAKKSVSDAESALIKQYGDGIVGVAKIYINTFGPGAALNTAKAVGLGADPSQAYIEALKQVVDGISKTQGLQQELTTAIENLSSLKAKQAEIESKEYILNKEAASQRVKELEADVSYYGELLSQVTHEAIKQTRIDVARISFTDQTLKYQIGVSDSITGGSFKITVKPAKEGEPAKEAKIDIASVAPSAKIDFAKLKTTMESSVKAVWPDSSVAAVDEVNSPGYFMLSIKAGAADEPDLCIDERQLLPGVEAKQPDTLIKETSADAEAQGMFTDILLKITDSKDSSEASSASQASASKWNVSLWFASASGSSNRSSASSQQRSDFFNSEMEIGFRVAKVAFDRGGWFNPQIFKMSHAFSRLADISVSTGRNVDDIKGKSNAELDEMFKGCILPAFPVAMAIVKDVTIKVKTSSMSSAAAKSVVEDSSAASGGLLCFSVSASSSSKSSSESAMHGSHGEYYYIRIPGPQVIGYFLEMVPKDIAEIYKPCTDPSGENPILEAFKLYDNAPELLRASDAVLREIREEKQEGA